MSPEEEQLPESVSALRSFSGEIVRATLVDLISKGLSWAFVFFVALVGVLIWKGGTVPAWVAVLAVAVAGLLAFISWRRSRTLRKGLCSWNERIIGLEQSNDELTSERDRLDHTLGVAAYELERHELYGAHLANVLDNFQRVICGDLPVTLLDYIQRGIMDPARLVLGESPDEQIRLSVLVPDGDAFRMIWASGHDLNSQGKFDVLRNNALANITLETGEAQTWADVTEDDRFVVNPKATREIRSMISIPLRRGDDVIGVFNCVASVPGAFTSAETSYVEAIGGILGLALNIAFERDRMDASRVVIGDEG